MLTTRHPYYDWMIAHVFSDKRTWGQQCRKALALNELLRHQNINMYFCFMFIDFKLKPLHSIFVMPITNSQSWKQLFFITLEGRAPNPQWTFEIMSLIKSIWPATNLIRPHMDTWKINDFRETSWWHFNEALIFLEHY